MKHVKSKAKVSCRVEVHNHVHHIVAVRVVQRRREPVPNKIEDLR